MLYKNLYVAHCHHIIFNIFDLINHTKEYLFLWATLVPSVGVCLLKEHNPQWATCGRGPWSMSSSKYQGWQCVWILYEELEFSNSYFHLNIQRGAAQSGFMSLLGIFDTHHYGCCITTFHCFVITSLFPQICKHLTALCMHLKLLFPFWLLSSHDKPFTVIILLLPE